MSRLAWAALLSTAILLPTEAEAQQFVGDNQWVAPRGVATLVPTAGEQYAQFILTWALISEWEFNAQVTHFLR